MLFGGLSSAWPVRSGVLVNNGIAYAGAGILARDGTYVVALDAETGKMKWLNDTCGKYYVSAQGSMTIAVGKLRLCGGAGVSPASFDLLTGKFEALAGQVDSLNRPYGVPLTKGAEIGVFNNNHIIYGGRPLYSERISNAVYRGRFSCVRLDKKNNKKAVEQALVNLSTIPPAWDDDIFVMPQIWQKRQPPKLICWDSVALAEFLDARSNTEKEISNRKIRFAETSRTLPMSKKLVEGDIVKWIINCDANGMVVASNSVLVTCSVTQGEDSQWFLRSLSKTEGKVVWEQKLPGQPAINGLCVGRDGSMISVMRDGKVLCYK